MKTIIIACVVVVTAVVVTAQTTTLQAVDVSNLGEATDMGPVYTGEYYMNVDDLLYEFTINGGGDARYKTMTEEEHAQFGSPSSLEEMGDVVSGTYTLTSNQLATVRYVFSLDENINELTTYNILPIRFDMTIDQCEHGLFKFQLLSTLKQTHPAYGKAEILNTNNDPNCYSTSLVGPVTFDKAACGIEYEQHELVLYTSNPVFLSDDASQIYNVTCRQDFTGVDVSHDVADVSVEIDEIQNVFDSAYLVDFKIVDPQNGDSDLADAFIGAPVKMVIRLNQDHRSDFDIKIDECKLNDVQIYVGGSGPTTSLFSEFEEPTEDVFESSYNLFRANTNDKSVQLEYACTITTCK